MQPKKFHHTKIKGIPRIDVSKMSQPDLTEQFARTFEKEYGTLQPGDSATEKWEALHDTMYHTSSKALPVRGTYRFSGLPGARLSRLLGAAQTYTGQNSARTSSLLP